MSPRFAVFLMIAGFGVGCGDDAVRESAAPSATATPAATPAEAPASAKVAIEGFTYDPARVTVRRGGEVTWDNADASNHTVTFRKGGPAGVDNLREGRKATVTFKERGSFKYICEFHPGMAGTVEVR